MSSPIPTNYWSFESSQHVRFKNNDSKNTIQKLRFKKIRFNIHLRSRYFLKRKTTGDHRIRKFSFTACSLDFFRNYFKALVTPYVRAHENYLLRRELEIEFDLNAKFYTQNVFYYSLFRRKRAYFTVTDTVFRLLLIVAYCGFFSLSKGGNELGFKQKSCLKIGNSKFICCCYMHKHIYI